jgi:hypothetical protein
MNRYAVIIEGPPRRCDMRRAESPEQAVYHCAHRWGLLEGMSKSNLPASADILTFLASKGHQVKVCKDYEL